MKKLIIYGTDGKKYRPESITELKELKDRGLITKEMFDKLKKYL